MRLTILASTILGVLTLSATANATPVSKTAYFHLHIQDGPSISFVIDPSILSDCSLGACLLQGDSTFVIYIVPFSGIDEFGEVLISDNPVSNFISLEGNPDAFPGFFEGGGASLTPFFSGSASDPTFISGTYDLYDSGYAYQDTVADVPIQLIISQTPEPSSLVLLGTGLLGCIGAMRRRL